VAAILRRVREKRFGEIRRAGDIAAPPDNAFAWEGREKMRLCD
jgi:hypothetical protein